ncbi:MAG: acyltransferase [Alicyclobacillaceae bacterium]|nr:acyltransferase [Alicyclobacillaceae bacterium]
MPDGERFLVALGQLRPRLGDVAANVARHLEWIAQARASGASLVVFPELGLTGYQVQDLVLDVARPLDHPDVVRLVEAADGIDVVFSFVEESDEHLFYVTSVYAADRQIRHRHRKVYLPTYGMFDEGRYFARGQRFEAFDTRFGRAGMMVCEDAWHVSSPYLLGLGGANWMLLPASSPARSVTDPEHFGSQKFWRNLLQVYAQLFGVHLVFVNRVGFEDGVNFFGGSGVVSPEGEWVAEAPQLHEALEFAWVDPQAVRRARYTTPILRDERWDVVLRELRRLAEPREGRVNP